MGLLILVVLFVAPMLHRASDKSNIYFYAFIGFWFATINHSAMRIAAPSFFYALGLISLSMNSKVLGIKEDAETGEIIIESEKQLDPAIG